MCFVNARVDLKYVCQFCRRTNETEKERLVESKNKYREKNKITKKNQQNCRKRCSKQIERLRKFAFSKWHLRPREKRIAHIINDIYTENTERKKKTNIYKKNKTKHREKLINIDFHVSVMRTVFLKFCARFCQAAVLSIEMFILEEKPSRRKSQTE